MGTVFNIQSYSLHDGPGIRTVVFLKGCPLRCTWCANPESQQGEPELYFDKAKCIYEKGCHCCESVCQRGAVKKGELEFDKCSHCLKCETVCPSKALSVYGKDMTVLEVVEAVEREQVFYRHGKGGITLSGGEPFMQSEFAVELLRTAKKHRIHTAVETCGYCSTNVLQAAAEFLDYIMYDIKLFDDEKHLRYTGVSNRLILENLTMLFEKFPNTPKLIRTPVIPTVNDNVEEIKKIKGFLSRFDNYTYELLPYHRFGENKYKMLGRDCPKLPKKLDEEKFKLLREL